MKWRHQKRTSTSFHHYIWGLHPPALLAFRHCKGADHSLELLLPNAPWVSSLSLSSGHCFSHQPIVWYPLFWLSAGSLSCVLASVVCYASLFLFAADHQGVLTFTVSLLSALLVHNHAGFYPDHLFHGNGPLKLPSGPHVVQIIPCTTAALRTALQAPPCTLVCDLCWSSLCLERLDRIPNSWFQSWPNMGGCMHYNFLQCHLETSANIICVFQPCNIGVPQEVVLPSFLLLSPSLSLSFPWSGVMSVNFMDWATTDWLMPPTYILDFSFASCQAFLLCVPGDLNVALWHWGALQPLPALPAWWWIHPSSFSGLKWQNPITCILNLPFRKFHLFWFCKPVGSPHLSSFSSAICSHWATGSRPNS